MGTSIWKSGDKTIECCNCGRRFVFTAGERKYFEQRNMREPKRCKTCRVIVKKYYQNINPYSGWESLAPTLYKGNFKGGIDVTDISGVKYRSYAYFGY